MVEFSFPFFFSGCVERSFLAAEMFFTPVFSTGHTTKDPTRLQRSGLSFFCIANRFNLPDPSP